jgi:hypothetical protein
LLRRLGLLVTVLSAAALGGCIQHITNEVAPPNLVFDQQSTDALVVLGCVGSGGFNTTSLGAKWYPEFNLMWLRTERDEGGHNVGFLTAMKRFSDALGHLELQHTVYAVRPGRYVLVAVSSLADYTPHMITVRTTELAKESALVFDAHPGEITYIGDFAVNALVFPAKIDRYSRDDAAASASLREYPNVKGELRFVRPVIIPAAELPVDFDKVSKR